MPTSKLERFHESYLYMRDKRHSVTYHIENAPLMLEGLQAVARIGVDLEQRQDTAARVGVRELARWLRVLAEVVALPLFLAGALLLAFYKSTKTVLSTLVCVQRKTHVKNDFTYVIGRWQDTPPPRASAYVNSRGGFVFLSRSWRCHCFWPVLFFLQIGKNGGIVLL